MTPSLLDYVRTSAPSVVDREGRLNHDGISDRLSLAFKDNHRLRDLYQTAPEADRQAMRYELGGRIADAYTSLTRDLRTEEERNTSRLGSAVRTADRLALAGGVGTLLVSVLTGGAGLLAVGAGIGIKALTSAARARYSDGHGVDAATYTGANLLFPGAGYAAELGVGAYRTGTSVVKRLLGVKHRESARLADEAMKRGIEDFLNTKEGVPTSADLDEQLSL